MYLKVLKFFGFHKSLDENLKKKTIDKKIRMNVDCCCRLIGLIPLCINKKSPMKQTKKPTTSDFAWVRYGKEKYALKPWQLPSNRKSLS